MDHKEIEQKDSIESIESGYASVESSNSRKCDICDSLCSENIVVYSLRQRTDSETTCESSNGNAVLLIGHFCHGCFADSSPIMAEKLKQKSRLQGYRPARYHFH